MIEVIEYSKNLKTEWDNFVESAENSSFLFFRDYMEYHNHVFKDFSLMVYEKGDLKALLPGNIKDGILHSHQGLTFGGLVHTSKFGFSISLKYLNAIFEYLKANKVRELEVKLQPFFYSNNFQQVIQFHFDSNTLVHQKLDIGAYIYLPNHSFPNKCVRTGKLKEYEYSFSDDFDLYWKILEYNLSSHHQTSPVHTLDEINNLKAKFPNNIRLLVLNHTETNAVHAGAVLYTYKDVVKVQYFATSIEGRSNRASDVLYYHVINIHKRTHTFIDFGTNTGKNSIVNITLLNTKEKFGAKELPIKTYKLNLNETINI